MNAGVAFLMYHELELPGRELCQSDPGYTRYIVPASAFESQMRCLKELGYQGVSVSQSLAPSAGKKVVITFDDGCATDLEVAAPVLRALNFSATFYVTAGFLGRRGFMTAAQLRELCGRGDLHNYSDWGGRDSALRLEHDLGRTAAGTAVELHHRSDFGRGIAERDLWVLRANGRRERKRGQSVVPNEDRLAGGYELRSSNLSLLSERLAADHSRGTSAIGLQPELLRGTPGCRHGGNRSRLQQPDTPGHGRQYGSECTGTKLQARWVGGEERYFL